MYILITLLILPIILILIFALFAIIFAWAWVRRLWYSITGKQPAANDPFSFYYNMRAGRNSQSSGSAQSSSSSYSGKGNRSQSASDSSRTNGSSSQKKIFSQSDGEYVDFEIVE